jgi:aspartate aminotransferase-like enzyme
MVAKGFPSVAAAGFQAPCVVVSYTKDPEMQSGKKFLDVGLQIAAGVPLQIGESPEFRTFRLGLFGLEKLLHIERAITHLEAAMEKIMTK